MSDTDYGLDDLLNEEELEQKKEEKKEKKKKKGITGLIVFLCIVAVLIGVPAAFLYLVIGDNAHEDLNIDETLTVEKLGEKMIVDAFDNTMDDGLIKIDLTRDDLNSIIDNSISDIKEASKGVIQQIYLNIEGTKYHVYLEAQVKEISWHTRMDLFMHLEETEEVFTFKIDDIGVGKLHDLKDALNSVIDKYASGLDLNSVFENLGLHMKLDLHAGTLTYNKADLLTDIKKMIPQQTDMLGAAFDTFFNEKYLKFNPNEDTFMTAEVGLNSFKDNANYTTNDDEHLIFNSPSFKSLNPGKDEIAQFVEPKLDSLIEEGIATEISHLTPLFELFFTGYSSLNDDDKNIVDVLYDRHQSSFDNLGVTNLNEYHGLRGEINEEELLSKTLTEIKARPLTELASGHIGHLYESDINNYIGASNLVGFTTIIARKDGDKLKYNTIVVDNFYCNLLNNVGYFVCGLNINGFSTSLIFDMPVISEETSGVHITFGIDKIFYGQNEIEGLADVLFRIIGEAFKEDKSFIINKEKQYITFNLNEILLQTNEILGENSIPPVSEEKFDITCIGDNLSEDGYIDIGFTI